MPFVPGAPPIIVAECGINDGGSIETAQALIRAAKLAGAHAVKWQQHHVAESSDERPWMHYDTARHACMVAHREGLAFGCTPFSLDALHGLVNLELDWLKLGSGELSNHMLVAAAAKHARLHGIPLVLSSGMHEPSDVAAALEVALRYTPDVAVLECTSVYPARPDQVRVRRMTRLGRSVYGLSDHSTGIGASVAAVALGAVMIERHFTLDRSAAGPDHAASLTPEDMRALVTACEEAWQAMQAADDVLPGERSVAAWARSSIYARRDLAVGQVLGPEDLVARRPFEPRALPGTCWLQTVGCVAMRDIRAGEAVGALDVSLTGRMFVATA